MSQIAMRLPSRVATPVASAPPSARRLHGPDKKVTRDTGGATLPRGPSCSATSVVAPEPLVVAMTSVVPPGRHPPEPEEKTCETSVIGAGVWKLGGAEGVGVAVGVALGNASVASGGVGERTVGVATADPAGEHAAMSAAINAATTFRIQGTMTGGIGGRVREMRRAGMTVRSSIATCARAPAR